MLSIIIIEDEKPAARRLERMLKIIGLKVKVKLHSVKESIQWLHLNSNPDLIFLDIQLSDGLSFEIFDQVTVESAIIFTTAYDEYALKAFKLNSVDYLLKPIDSEELETAILKFQKIQLNKHENYSIDFNKIKELIQEESQTYKERFTTQIGQHLRIVETKDIECIYSEDKASYAYLKTRRTYLLDTSLDTIFTQLNPKTFFKVNRKFIVNLHAINDIISYTNSRLQIKLNNYSQEEIVVSREKVKDFKNWLA